MQHPFILKIIFYKLSIEEKFLNLIQNIYQKATVNMISNGEISNIFSSGQEQQKDVHSHYFYSVLYQKSKPIQFNKAR